jgi:hypothetical protein
MINPKIPCQLSFFDPLRNIHDPSTNPIILDNLIPQSRGINLVFHKKQLRSILGMPFPMIGAKAGFFSIYKIANKPFGPNIITRS